MVFDIISYDCLSCVLTNGVNIVTFRPELTTQHPFDLWIEFENLSRGDAFDGLDDIFRGCRGGALYEQVDMIKVGANFDKVDIISLLYFNTGFSERFDHTIGQYFPSVLYGAYNVIQQAGFVVALAYMSFYHATNIHWISLPSQQAGRKSF